MQNFVSVIEGGTQTEGVQGQGGEKNAQTEEKWSDRRLEKAA
jgi:hypothetical protein